MFRMKERLEEMAKKNSYIRIGIVGCGKMGQSFIAQLGRIGYMLPSIVIDHTPEKAYKALEKAGFRKIIRTDRLEDAQAFIQEGGSVVTSEEDLLYKMEEIDVLVEATGNPANGAEVAYQGIQNAKHVVMLNVECDSVVGPILYQMAEEKGVIYTGIYGDEPGAIMELVRFAENTSLEILAVGKGKNNQLDREATDQTLAEEAKKKKLSPHMLCSFVDGSNTMTELTTVCNATGFLPDVMGCHGITTSPESIVDDLKLKAEGGILENKGVVEFAFGMAPGVFALVRSEDEDIQDLMTYQGMGQGPNYLLYRPYHLTSMEAPISVFQAVVYQQATIAPVKGQQADAITVAKRDLKAGESLRGIGRDTVYGLIVSHDQQVEDSLLPIGLVDQETYVKEDIKKGDLINLSQVRLNEDALIVKLRKEQDQKGI